MEPKKFIKVADMIISNKFHETLKNSNDPFYDYFCKSIENIFSTKFEILGETIKSELDNV
jgi:hypothetical protein